MFEPEAWSKLLRTLDLRTIEGKIEWRDTRNPLHSAFRGSMIAALAREEQQGEFIATVGENQFRLGSADGDGREPYFLEVTRGVGAPAVTDALRTDVARMNHELYKAADRLRDLYRHVGAYIKVRGRVVENIISDLDNL